MRVVPKLSGLTGKFWVKIKSIATV